jgi:hypothetical protein
VITIAQICTAIAGALRDVPEIVRVQDAAQVSIEDGMSEAIADLPTAQVYWQTSETSAGFDSDRATFTAGVRVTQMLFHIDVYVRQRAQLNEDAAETLRIAEVVQTALEAQRTKPLFGLAGVQAFRWSAERVVFEYGQVGYAGVRFAVTVWVF